MRAGGARLYRRIGHRLVTGFLETEVLDVLAAIDGAQADRGVAGSVLEVGVHHGKLFLGLHLLRRTGESSVAVDLFGDQELNIDSSGSGDLEKVRANVALWADDEGLVVHQGDSIELTSKQLVELAGGGIRLFSVDGGHTAETVYNDMVLAEAALVPGGVVIADDVFNQQWPGVAVGTLRYLEGAELVPFAIGFNKVLFTRPEFAGDYRRAVDGAFAARLRVATQDSTFAGHEVTLMLRQGPALILRRSETARSVYHAGYRGMVSALSMVTRRR
ncbi:MAG TPA: class I SAM-dependent methyltransferase [Marmoricola sp.]|nr:class I SAM-dependent methyltransferase [Marmoricola sp.]